MSQLTHRTLHSSCPTADRVDYGSAKAYADEVREWVDLTQTWLLQQQTAMLQAFQPPMPDPQTAAAMLNMNVNVGNGQTVPPGVQGQVVRRIVLRFNMNGAEPQLDPNIREEYTIPSFVRRVAAEIIDFLILFIFKMLFVYVLVELELIDIDQYIKILADDVDLNSLIDITQGLFHLELCAKIVCSVIEAYSISYGIGATPAGCTPGKYILGIKVVYCRKVEGVLGRRDRVIVERRFEESNVPMGSSMLRAFVKNGVFNVLFPLNLLLYFFAHNRAMYDMMARTIVVNINNNN